MHTERGRLGSRQEQIATNDFLYPNYKATNRHELRRIATGGSVDLYFLHIYSKFDFVVLYITVTL